MVWIWKEARGLQVAGLIILCVSTQLGWSIFVFSTTLALGFIPVPIEAAQNLESGSLTSRVSIHASSLFTLLSKILTEIAELIAEEILYRFPLVVPILLRWSPGGTLGIAIILSILFGLAHGNAYHILIQGVGGFFYAILFLKCGGAQRHFPKALSVTVATHILYDGTLIGLGLASEILINH